MKTRKRRNNFRRVTKSRSRSIKGGADDEYSIGDLKKLDNVLQDYIKDKKEKAHPGIVPVITGAATKVKDFVQPYLENVASVAIDLVGSKTGVNPANKGEVAEKLQGVINTVNDPVVQEKTKEAIGAIAKNVAVAVKASEPALKQLAKTTADTVAETTSKVGKSGVKVALEILEEVPVAGAALGFIAMIDNITKAGQSLINANAKIAEASGDTWAEAADNFMTNKDKLRQELDQETNAIPNLQPEQRGGLRKVMKKNAMLSDEIMAKVGGSIEDFNNTTMHPYTILNRKTRSQNMRHYNNRTRHRHRS